MWARVRAGAEAEKEEARHIIQQVGRAALGWFGGLLLWPEASSRHNGACTLAVFHSCP